MSFDAVEKVVDRVIPWLVLLLGIEIILGFIYDLHDYEGIIHWFDRFVITVFVADLVFKWFRVRSMRVFIRLYWLDIVAVLPFYWVFSTYEWITGSTRIAEESQKFVHEALLIREAKVAREIELIKSASRGELFFVRIIESVQKILRLLVLQWEIAHGHIKRAHLELHHNKPRYGRTRREN
ncbi:hypothetical protein HY486_02075 [Candidatus Woesearchaeota archaeon]|nr:hypothetical protein [Candidatus Woesearchaeota archaeon]